MRSEVETPSRKTTLQTTLWTIPIYCIHKMSTVEKKETWEVICIECLTSATASTLWSQREGHVHLNRLIDQQVTSFQRIGSGSDSQTAAAFIDPASILGIKIFCNLSLIKLNCTQLCPSKSLKTHRCDTAKCFGLPVRPWTVGLTGFLNVLILKSSQNGHLSPMTPLLRLGSERC